MKLKVLVDNNTFIDMYYLGEPAVSYYIEDNDNKILFDTGYSNVFIENAKKMNIDLDEINKIVISHGHNDHTRGLMYLTNENRNIELISHPNTFNHKEIDKEDIGSPLSIKELEKIYKLNLTKEPIKISENITYLGEIPQTNDFEIREQIGYCKINNKIIDDYNVDDSAIVYKSNKGLFIITGCSHSGICNIIEYAKKVCNCNKIYGVIGGFHLFEINERLEKTINYLKENDIELIYPCHCVSLKSKIEMSKKLKIQEVGTGLNINI